MQIITIALTADQLKCIVIEAVESAIKNNVPEPIKEPQIVDGDFIIEKIGITRQTLTNWRNKNKIPYFKQGGIIRYDFNKVVEAIENKKGRAAR